MVTLDRVNIIVFKYLDAGVRITIAIDDITGADEGINVHQLQIADGRLEPLIFGMYIADKTNSPVSHSTNLWGARDHVLVILSRR